MYGVVLCSVLLFIFSFFDLFSALECALYILRSSSVSSANGLTTYSSTTCHPASDENASFMSLCRFLIKSIPSVTFFGVVYVGRIEIFTFYYDIDLSHLPEHHAGYVCTVHHCLFFEIAMSLSLSHQFWRVDSPTWPLGFLVSFSGIHIIWYLTMLSSHSITGLARH